MKRLSMCSGKADGDFLFVRIQSALYGPSERRRLLSGELDNSEAPAESTSILFTRDVTRFVRDLLRSTVVSKNLASARTGDHDDSQVIRISAVHEGMERSKIPLSPPLTSMNAEFGDPSPGTSKSLWIRYSVTARDGETEVHEDRFAEHEPVSLRRYNRVTKSGVKSDVSLPCPTTLLSTDEHEPPMENTTVSQTLPNCHLSVSMAELVLPLIMPFLEVRQRVRCQRVCQNWMYLIRDWGVAKVIDSQDAAFLTFTERAVRGLLLHSFSSLECLFIAGMESLDPAVLHAAVPNLRRLRVLDVSSCRLLDDTTLTLLSSHETHVTLEVLYMKGLRKVTDDGIITLASHCTNLRVLELSNIPLTDRGVESVGRHLTKLRALFLRDNFKLTNDSIDIITNKCHHLEQLTLWGLIRLKRLALPACSLDTVPSANTDSSPLTILNLWGCHGLRDNVATAALAGMTHLRSLSVGECHRLTDDFVTEAVRMVLNLRHLNLRYCRLLTDASVKAIARGCSNIYSLDLSFCTRITANALFSLLDLRASTLIELRLLGCRQLAICQIGRKQRITDRDGSLLLNALRVHGPQGSSLLVLDVRDCGGLPKGVPLRNDGFATNLAELGFRQEMAAFFMRSASFVGEAQ